MYSDRESIFQNNTLYDFLKKERLVDGKVMVDKTKLYASVLKKVFKRFRIL
jgi:hypothetical protein